MKKTGTKLTEWAVRKVESEFKDDVCLLLGQWSSDFNKAEPELNFHYYIPATSRSNALARTFIVEGVGYDLFPMSWERVERIADLKGDNPVCLDEAEILYARNDDDRQRFTSLQARLRANLQNPHFMYNRALESLDTAMEIHREMLFEDDLCAIRESAGHICIHAANAVAYVNQQYFGHMQTDRIKQLQSMRKIPAGFIDLHKRIIRAKTADEQKKLCHDIIVMTRKFLEQHDVNAVRRISEPDFSELAFWYQELRYTWLRVYHWCDKNDPVNAYLWCCFLQNEVDRVGAEFGISDIDILSSFDAENLPAFRRRAEVVEQKIVAAIEANGVTIESYPSVEDFLEKNP